MSITFSGNITATFTGRSTSGTISVPGLKVGDKLIWLYSPEYVAVAGQNLACAAIMEPTVSVDDELQQVYNNDYSTYTFTAILVRA